MNREEVVFYGEHYDFLRGAWVLESGVMAELTKEQVERAVPLTKGYVALVDGADYERIARNKWWVSVCGKKIYAVRDGKKGEPGEGRRIYMHREIMGLLHDDPMQVDHEERKLTLDNRRSNLRLATSQQQKINTGIQSHNTSGVKGVRWMEKKNRWLAFTHAGGKYKHIGHFKSKEEGHIAYVRYMNENFGEFAGDGDKWIGVAA